MSLMTTFTGRRIDPLNLRLEDVDITDVAHALALCNRFAGHTIVPVSVAQHSVYVCRLLWNTGGALCGLLHDASEAYLGDVVKWVKDSPAFSEYREVERRAQQVIYERFGVTHQSELLEYADSLMVRFEAEKTMPRLDVPSDQVSRYPPVTQEERNAIGFWSPWDWRTAEARFLHEFESLARRP